MQFRFTRMIVLVVGETWHRLLQEFSHSDHVKPQYRELIRYAKDADQVLPLLKREE